MNLRRSRFLKLLGMGIVGTQARGEEKPAPAPAGEMLRLGIITDCQYADIDTPPKSKRQYRLSPKKLKEAVGHFNKMADLDYVLHLGDLIDRHIVSFDALEPTLRELKFPLHHVIGNHDYDVLDAEKEKIAAIMGRQKLYTSLSHGMWKLILLDGNVVSLFAKGKEDPATVASRNYQQANKKRKLPDYCGGLGEEQRTWLEGELKAAAKTSQKAILFCHYPVQPIGPHALWDAEAVMEILKANAGAVAAWFNGHNHDGNYAAAHGMHFLNFRGMVDTLENSYARVELTQDKITVQGFGREPSRELILPAPDKAPETPAG